MDNVLLSVLKQLAGNRTSISDNIQAFYHRCEKRRERPLHEDILKALQTEVTLHSKVFLLLDALDEFLVSGGFFSQLSGALEACELNIMATSRSFPEIVGKFRTAKIMEIRANDHDVHRYLEAHIHRLPRFVNANPALQEEIKTGIVKSVEGM